MKLHHMEIHPAQNGGVAIHHISSPKVGKNGVFVERPEPQVHVFGSGQGQEAMAHIAKHAGIQVGEEKAGEGYEPSGEADEEEMPRGK